MTATPEFMPFSVSHGVYRAEGPVLWRIAGGGEGADEIEKGVGEREIDEHFHSSRRCWPMMTRRTAVLVPMILTATIRSMAVGPRTTRHRAGIMRMNSANPDQKMMSIQTRASPRRFLRFGVPFPHRVHLAVEVTDGVDVIGLSDDLHRHGSGSQGDGIAREGISRSPTGASDS